MQTEVTGARSIRSRSPGTGRKEDAWSDAERNHREPASGGLLGT